MCSKEGVHAFNTSGAANEKLEQCSSHSGLQIEWVVLH